MISRLVKKTITMMEWVVANKEKKSGTKFHFVVIIRSNIGKAKAAKDLKEGEIRRAFKNRLKGGYIVGST